MDHIIETDRLLLITYSLEMIRATIEGPEALEEITGYEVSRDWPGIDFFFYLPYVLENVEKKPAMTRWTKLVVLKEAKMIIGEIGGQGDPDETGEIELGYSIVPAYQNQGYMSEAIAALLNWLLQEPVIHKIFARCYATNQASIQVLRHNHFTYMEGQDVNEPVGKVLRWEYLREKGE
ncbi:ribosomal-protein-L7/L12-serine acetyltransferase [Listeria grayi]|uniref:N-acetyltransferase domain-containing protein n=1 Tax=Listeria grayi FSL F6-1183 TaxID=1265827 RepID=A0A829R994_LISGR|nr:GNAT family N-acetyltransferase [Listeria grayi]EUJ29228.1 hypothetical protein LMUR_03828 [Listeria grayi FSL F6-1183]MBC1922295.1 GNAT family N-acetyltransferase [Listeria grayi]VEI32683.1 ribosomal-protein-L7/L12-serine acetyltransferase [Listeria grayi]